MPLRRMLPLALLGLALAAPRAQATSFQIIDSFNAPPDIAAPDTDSVTVAGVAAQRVSTVDDGTMASFLGNLTITGAGAIGTITWKPDNGTFDLASNDRFALDVVGTPDGTWIAKLFASDGTNDFEDAHPAAGAVFFMFSDFIDTDSHEPVDFSALTEIKLTLVDDRVSSIDVGELRAVPEPTTALLLFLGLLGLAHAGRPRATA